MMDDRTEALEGLRLTAEEAFSGLHADEALRLRILRTAGGEKKERRSPWLSPARLVPAACGILILAIGSASVLRERRLTADNVPEAEKRIVSIGTAGNDEGIQLLSEDGHTRETSVSSLRSIRAGGDDQETMVLSGSGISATVIEGSEKEDTLFETHGREIPVICMNGAAYQLLKEPEELNSALIGDLVGRVDLVTETPSLEVGTGKTVSDCAGEGADIYSLSFLPVTAAVAARVNGTMRLFQRVSYAGCGTGNASLAELLGIRGQVEQITPSFGKTLFGDEAEKALEVLLGSAVCVADDAEKGSETVTFTLSGGLRLQMTLDGDRLVGCGAWKCPEFLAILRQE